MSDGLNDYVRRTGARHPSHDMRYSEAFGGHVCNDCGIPASLYKAEKPCPGAANAMPAELFPGNRSEYPVFTGLLMYFPHACAAVARCSLKMNEQHNPGEPMHWDKSKSIGTGDQTVRHLMDSAYGTPPNGDVDHAANHAWRALEYLERLILAQRGKS